LIEYDLKEVMFNIACFIFIFCFISLLLKHTRSRFTK
jgi:uncharacterized membrane protein